MINWSVSPNIFSIGPLQVRWYGLLFMTGFFLGFLFMQKICRVEKVPIAKLDSLLIHLLVGTGLGARLGHCFFYEWGYYSEHLLEIPQIWRGGLASHGGALGVIIAVILFVKKNPEFKLFWLLDRLAVPVALTGAFIRLGNLMNSEIIGRPTDLPWSFIFEQVDKIPRHPTQIYESLCYLFVWAGGIYWYRRFKFNPPNGFLFGWTLAGIFTARIFLEFLKENQEAFESTMVLNMGQLLSIPYVVVGYYLFLRTVRSNPLDTKLKTKL
ncbi:MAG: prolipoprotein diacylglyceryl transferase [Bdellovibrionaceae bacterium]|nr:prolipoprotein diacylglyceryl transferase [Pseudobdellovibrionaceae bacterium]